MSLAQVIQKTRKRTAILFGKVSSNKFATIKIKKFLIGNTQENRDKNLKKVTELAKHSRKLSSTSNSSSD